MLFSMRHTNLVYKTSINLFRYASTVTKYYLTITAKSVSDEKIVSAELKKLTDSLTKSNINSYSSAHKEDPEKDIFDRGTVNNPTKGTNGYGGEDNPPSITNRIIDFTSGYMVGSSNNNNQPTNNVITPSNTVNYEDRSTTGSNGLSSNSDYSSGDSSFSGSDSYGGDD